MGDRASAAIERIERALARIEAAAESPASAASAPGPDTEELREAHRTLKAKVEEAVALIDRLLGAEAGG